MGALVQVQRCGKAGLKIDLKKEPADGFWDNVWLKGAFVASYWGGRAAATQMLSVAYAAGAPWNETHWKNDKFEKLLADAKAKPTRPSASPTSGRCRRCCTTTAARSFRCSGLARRP